ncbi:hypothetical protein PVAP13_7NG294000 [Panicum virgatum]|uniref:Uncharacterized protein n=1 Tax=Panicum virgatum TaxID=38727 RepID=A0A8T0Q4B4_PANVG|nr:hypothetical protein PVAP13_7NG294000 [Panicum virgatum]
MQPDLAQIEGRDREEGGREVWRAHLTRRGGGGAGRPRRRGDGQPRHLTLARRARPPRTPGAVLKRSPSAHAWRRPQELALRAAWRRPAALTCRRSRALACRWSRVWMGQNVSGFGACD